MIILRQKEFGRIVGEKAKQIAKERLKANTGEYSRKAKRDAKKIWEKTTDEYKNAKKKVKKDIKDGVEVFDFPSGRKLDAEQRILRETRDSLRRVKTEGNPVNRNWWDNYNESPDIAVKISPSEFAKIKKQPKYTKAKINTTGSLAFPYTSRK